MLAFGNDTALKAFLLDRLAEYREADRPIGDPNRLSGECDAVVRTLEALQTWRRLPATDNDARLYATDLGIPRILAHLEDQIFVDLAQVDAQAWPERFIAAIRPSTALDMIWPRFALWLLDDEASPHTEYESKERAAIADTAALYREWLNTGTSPEFMRWARQSSVALGLADAIEAPDAKAFSLYAAYNAAEAAGHAGRVATSGGEQANSWAASAGNSAAAASGNAAEAAYRAAYSAAAPFTADQYATENAAQPARAAAARRQADKLVELLAAAAPAEPTRDQRWLVWKWWQRS